MSLTAPYKLSPGGVVTLFQIQFDSCVAFTPTTGSNVLIKCSPYRNGTTDIVYPGDGDSYQFVGVQVNGLRSELNGVAPKPTLTFDKASLYQHPVYADMKSQFQSQTDSKFFDWRGAKVRIIKYYVNGSETLYLQEFRVDQVTTITEDTVQVQLTVSLGIDNLQNDSVQTLALNRCSLRYRIWNPDTLDFDYTDDTANGCPYGNPTTPTDYSAVPSFGIKFFTADDVELLVANKQYDECSLTVKGCQLRFDPANAGLNLPFKGLWSPEAKIGS